MMSSFDSFDLSQALEDSPELPAFNDGFDSFCMTDAQEQIIKLDEGLDMVVSHNPNTMQSVVTLMLAVTKMKKPLTRCVAELSSRELCSALLDSLMEETIEETKVNFCSNGRRLFRRLSSIEQGNLCDLSQKQIILESETLELRAIILKAGDLNYKVNFRLEKYSPSSPCEGQPILLSIPDRSRYISCSKTDSGAVLKLEEIHSAQDLDEIYDNDCESRFLFYRRTSGISLNTFESVSCPGWFISTDEERMDVCQQASTHQTLFKISSI